MADRAGTGQSADRIPGAWYGVQESKHTGLTAASSGVRKGGRERARERNERSQGGGEDVMGEDP